MSARQYRRALKSLRIPIDDRYRVARDEAAENCQKCKRGGVNSSPVSETSRLTYGIAVRSFTLGADDLSMEERILGSAENLV